MDPAENPHAAPANAATALPRIAERTAVVGDPSAPVALVRMMIDRRDVAGAREAAARIASEHGWKGDATKVVFVPPSEEIAYVADNAVPVGASAREMCRSCGYAVGDAVVVAGEHGALLLRVTEAVDYADLVAGRPFAVAKADGTAGRMHVRGAGASLAVEVDGTRTETAYAKLLDGPIERPAGVAPERILSEHLAGVEATLLSIARTHFREWLADVAGVRKAFLRERGGSFVPHVYPFTYATAHPDQPHLERFDAGGDVAPMIRVWAIGDESHQFDPDERVYVPGPIVTPAGILQAPLIDADDGLDLGPVRK